MAQAAGNFVLGEGAIAARPLARQLWTGPERFGFAVYLTVTLFGLWAMGWAGAKYVSGEPLSQGGVTLLLMAAWAVPLTLWFGGWRQKALRRIWMRRGVPDPLPMQWIADEAGFTIVQPAQETRIAWAGVTEIIPARRHWLVLANMVAHCVPKHAFADTAAERAFVGAVVAHLTDAARARSAAAAAFVNR